MLSLQTEAATEPWNERPRETVPPVQSFHLSICPSGRPGAENMAIDAGLLEQADQTCRAFLRLYRFAPSCLSLGRNEPARKRYDRAAIAHLGIDVVRRPTGGRAVWHEHEVTYAVAAPVQAFGCLRDSYRTIHERLAAALRTLGVDATLAPDHPLPSSTGLQRLNSCFAAPTGGEVLVAGRKLIGSAQLRQGQAFLQHGSILLDGSQDVIRAVSGLPEAVSGETTLAAVLGRPVPFEEVADAIVRVWGEGITSTVFHRPPPSSTALFRDPAWTWRR